MTRTRPSRGATAIPTRARLSSAVAECRTLRGMSSPEVERRLRQQGADVDSLYEISGRIEGKVDALDERVGALDGRVGALDQRVGALVTRMDERFAATDAKLDAILERLNRD